MQRSHELARAGELPILGGRGLERVRLGRIIIRRVRHATCLAVVESERLAASGAQVQGRQRIDLARMRNRRDRAEDSLRLIDASAVVGLDPRQVEPD